MSRNKKILVGVAIVLALGAIAFANFKFKRHDGVEVTTEAVKKRHLEAIVSASGKIQAKRDVNISADTMGRVTELAVDEGYRVKKGQFLMQIDPRNLKSAVQRTEASLAAARSNAEQVRLALDSARVALKQAQDNYKRQQDLWKGGLTTRETLEKAENDLKARQSDLASQEQNVRTMQLRMESESATAASARYDLSKVRIESPIDGIVTRRNIEEGETVVIGTMNNAGTVLLTIADMSVIQAEVEVDETDIPITPHRPAGEGHDRRDARARRSPARSPRSATARSRRPPARPTTQATNFKVVVHARQGDRRSAPRLHLHRGDHDRRTRRTPSRCRSRRRPCARWSSTRRATSSARRRPEGQAPGRRRRRRAAHAELKPGQTRKELEGVFVVQDNKAVFTPIKTGIAGEKYFEVLSGLKEGDRVIIGPVRLGPRARGRRGSRVKPRRNERRRARKP